MLLIYRELNIKLTYRCKEKHAISLLFSKKSVTLHLGCTKQLFILIKKELIHNNKTI